MRFYKTFMAAAAMLLMAQMPLSAQLRLPVKTIGRESFYYYKVKKNESVYEVAQKLRVTKDDIIKYNPSASEGFVKDQTLFFPVSAFGGKTGAAPAQRSAASATYETVVHTVKKGETVYGISKAYGISQERLIEANPSIDIAMNVGDEIVIPIARKATTTTAEPGRQNSGVIFHTIKRGETLYGVAHKYNTSVENVIALNPGLGNGSFRADDVIKIKPNTPQDIKVSKEFRQFVPYTVKQGDTYESVARSHGLTVAQLRDNNPGVDKLKKGKVIYLPKSGYEERTVNSSTATEKELERTYSGKIGSVYSQLHKAKSGKEVKIGIILPFQLQKQDPPKQALLYTEFYKGFLIAADSIGKTGGKKISINVYDTEHNLNKTDSILALPELKQLDLIIAPSEPKQLERINTFGERNGIAVLNCFSMKNDDYASNSSVIQANVPASYLATYVGDWICDRFKKHTVVFLEDPETEDKDMYSNIKNEIVARKMSHKTLTIASDLTAKKLSQYLDPGTNYVFLPNSGSRKLTSKFIGALAAVKSDRFDCGIALIGYPEYIIYPKETVRQLHKIDTYYFSRFYSPATAAPRRVESLYKAKFGEDMMNTAPKMGLMGFDVGLYVMKSLAGNAVINESTPRYEGVQSNFNFTRASNWGGLFNKSYVIVHCTPSGQTRYVVR